MSAPALDDDYRQLMSWVDERAQAARAHQRRHADRRQDRAQLRRRGHRPVPHRAHVLRRGQDPGRAPDDPGRHASPSGGARSTRSCPCSGRTSSASSAPWTGCRSPSACSIRRCTSSCRTEAAQIDVVASELGVTADGGARRASRRCTRPTRCSAIAAAAWRITHPEIYETQVRAIIEAAGDGGQRAGRRRPARDHDPDRRARARAVDHEASWWCARPTRCWRARRSKLPYTVGTMIELPRACLVADQHRQQGASSSPSAPTT